MQYKSASCLLITIGFIANAGAQVQAEPPSEVLLTTVQSGVLPVIPTATPFAGVETIEGAIVYDGPMNPGFTGVLGNAVVQSNTPGTAFKATLPSGNFDPFTGSTITGSISGTVPSNGTGVIISVDFTGFPSDSVFGPFAYHIHTLPIAANGNCTTSMGHLDPTDRGEYYPCDITQPETCQAGDLAGKHGNITTTSFSASYLELYLSTNPASPYYFGDKSIVVHAANTTRLTCANFMSFVTTVSNGTMSTGTGTVSSPSATSTLMPFTGAASNVVVVGSSVFGSAVLAAFALLF